MVRRIQTNIYSGPFFPNANAAVMRGGVGDSGGQCRHGTRLADRLNRHAAVSPNSNKYLLWPLFRFFRCVFWPYGLTGYADSICDIRIAIEKVTMNITAHTIRFLLHSRNIRRSSALKSRSFGDDINLISARNAGCIGLSIGNFAFSCSWNPCIFPARNIRPNRNRSIKYRSIEPSIAANEAAKA